MPIFSIKGNIFQHGPKVAEVIAVWLRTGYNMRWVTWQHFVERHGDSLIIAGASLAAPSGNPRSNRPTTERFRQEPWRAKEDLLCGLADPIEKCKYIYLFSNPDDLLGCRRVEEVSKMVRRSLDAAADTGAKSVALMHIPTVQNHESPTVADDEETAKVMIDSATLWLENHSEKDFAVYLVDLRGDFEVSPGVDPYRPGEV